MINTHRQIAKRKVTKKVNTKKGIKNNKKKT